MSVKFFLRIKRRLRLIFHKLKHRFLFFAGIKPYFCGKKHDAKVFENFRPKISVIFEKIIRSPFAPEFLKDKVKLAELCRKTINGNIQIFNDQFLNVESFDLLWFNTCQKKLCDGCELDFVSGQFCWDLMAELSKKINHLGTQNPDIRIAWEFSRLQFLMPLAVAHFYGLGSKASSDFVKKVIESWMKKNDYLTGPNWTCAMEAAIRAVNLIWIVCLMDFDQAFQSKIAELLYLHKSFIEDCFEEFDRPNNHVLSDLLGLIYLNSFFDDKIALDHCFGEFSKQFDQQVFGDGSSYEGSTGYHRLVCEMFIHFQAIHETFGSGKLGNKKDKIFQFFKSCFDYDGNLLPIGDLDSSKFVFGLEHKNNAQQGLSSEFFNDFGIIFFRDKNIFCSLKLPTGKKSQPTGHFHADWLSVTLKIFGIDIFIDSGSGFYLRNKELRNYLRSFYAHSTIFPKAFDQAYFKEGLFCFDQFVDSSNFFSTEPLSVAGAYKKQDFEFVRNLEIIPLKGTKKFKVIITDQALDVGCQELILNFILAPDLILKKLDDFNWNLESPNGLFLLESSIDLNIEKTKCSPSYGVVLDTHRLSFKNRREIKSKVVITGPI